jgi:outer membrane receptor for ferrienterochelin and colicins
MKKKTIAYSFLPLILFCLFNNLFGQDSLRLDEIVITATKTERSLSKIPLPVTSISAKEIHALGSSRLQDVLLEQVGINIVPQINGLGNGLQLQGLNPDYTLILIDGEPVVGRYTGSLELNRITAGEIKKIEIVKGPSSSLYGSDALAGVVNIITHKSLTNKLTAQIKYAERNTLDASVGLSYNKANFSNQIFYNRFSTDGYDLSKNIYGQTVSPYQNNTLRYKLSYSFLKNHEISLSAKYFLENQNNAYHVINGLDSIKVFGDGVIRDWSVFPSYQYKLTNKTNIILRSYYTEYYTKTNLKELDNKSDYYNDNFKQTFLRPEIQSTCTFSKKQNWTLGSGWIRETINTNRYGSGEDKQQETYYGFIQHEWIPSNKWNVLSGMRFDYNSIYHKQWSPKIAAQYTVNSLLSLRASFGTGFKAPDFRQLYLNFNNAAAGYSVFGTEALKPAIEDLLNKNQIRELFIPFDAMTSLRAERSNAWNIGASLIKSKHAIHLNLFRNDISDLIETQTVALTNQQNFIYSYSNIKRAFTQGFELNYKYQITKDLDIQSSYQFLQAKDKDVLENIDKGLVFGRDPVTLQTYRIKKSDYIGLPHRSTHSGNIKLNYRIPYLDCKINARLILKGPFGLAGTNGSVNGTSINSSDSNSNSIIDKYDRLVKGYGLLNIGIQRDCSHWWDIQLGADNLLNYTDPINQPTLIGRTAYIKMNFKFIQNK